MTPLPAAFSPSHITLYGAFHTLVSALPVLLGLYLYLAKGTIDMKTGLGKLYWATTLIGTVTGLFIFHHGGFGPPHVITIFMTILLLIPALTAYVVKTRTRTIEIFCLSLSYFLLWFFTTTEGLTRFPAAQPFAADPGAPSLIPVRLILLVLLAAGIFLQIRAERKKAA